MHLTISKTSHSAEAIHRAAYKIADLGSISLVESPEPQSWTVQLTPKPISNTASSTTNPNLMTQLLHEFQVHLSDEVLRETLNTKTAPLRNLILAHAYSNTQITK